MSARALLSLTACSAWALYIAALAWAMFETAAPWLDWAIAEVMPPTAVVAMPMAVAVLAPLIGRARAFRRRAPSPGRYRCGKLFLLLVAACVRPAATS